MKKFLIVLALVGFAFSCKTTTCECTDSSCDGQCMEMMECGDDCCGSDECDGSGCAKTTECSGEGGTCPVSGK